MRRTQIAFAVSATVILVVAATGGLLFANQIDAGAIRAPWSANAPDARQDGQSTSVAEVRELLIETAEIVKLDLLEKVGGALDARRAGVTTSAAGPTSKTLYFHSILQGDVERGADFGRIAGDSGIPGPSMDENPPTSPISKTQTAGAAGNNNFRKNLLLGYFGGAVTGRVTDLSVSVYVQGVNQLETTVFGDGILGVSTPIARKTTEFSAPVPTEVVIHFPEIDVGVTKEIVVSFRVLTATGVTTPGSSAVFLYDSTAHPSSVSFTLGPLTAQPPALDDPAGIAFQNGKTIVMNAGAGDILALDGAAAPVRVASGYLPGGFLRGLADAVTDGAGNVFFAEPDTGNVHILRADGTTGVYATDLGAPTGLALDASGNLFVGDAGTGAILKVTPSRAVSEVAKLPRNQIFDLAFAPNGTLTASTFRPAFLWDVDIATGVVAERGYLGADRTMEGLAYDDNGDLWVGSSLQNASGRLLRVATNGTFTTVNDTLGGPLRLAFIPGTSSLVIASQGELTTTGDAVLTFAAPALGYSPTAPTLPTASVDASWAGWIHRGSGGPVHRSAYHGILPVGEMIDVGRDPAEPTLGVQTDGDIFTVAASSAKSRLRNPLVTGLGEPAVMRSQDNGRTWEIVSPDVAGVNDPPATADPFVYVDTDTDRVFTFDLAAACHILSYSDDSGESWTTNRLACGVPPVDHQSMVAAKPRASPTFGYPNVLYHCTNWIAISPCGRSLDGGDTWHPAAPAFQNVVDVDSVRTEPPGACAASGGLLGHLGADLEGRVMVGKSRCGAPVAAITEDDGLSWRVVTLNATVGISGHDIDFAVDSANNLYAAWIAANGRTVFVASTDNGHTWGPAQFASPAGLRQTSMPSIAASGVGQVAVSYIGSPGNYGYAAQIAPRMVWNMYLTHTTDALAADTTLVTITAHDRGDPITRGDCARPCSGIWDFLDLRIGPDGRAWATTVDACLDACVTDRTVTPIQLANTYIATFAVGPNLKAGGALAPR